MQSAALSGLAFRKGCTWTPRGLIFAALLWAWSDEEALTERFVHARKVVATMAILPGMPATTYQAFLKKLRTWTGAIASALVAAFRRRMAEDLADRFRVLGYPVFGVDGSRLELPRTASNEGRFSPARSRRRARSKAAPGARSARRRPTARRCG